MSNLHNGPIGLPEDFGSMEWAARVMGLPQPADPKVVPISRKTVLPEFPESTDTKVISRAEYDRLVRAEAEAEENAGLRFTLQTIIQLHRTPFPHPVFSVERDKATRDDRVHKLLQDAGLLAPDASFDFGGKP